MECTYSICVHVPFCTCVSVCADSFTLQVPMQPTGLSGRPLNPSLLLMARKRYACRKTHTSQHLVSKHNIHTAHDLTANLSDFRDIKSASLSVHFPVNLLPLL